MRNMKSEKIHSRLGELLQAGKHDKLSERHRRMDAKTYPNGVLEEMEKSTHKMEKSKEAWRVQLQCRYSCMFTKGILADSRQPDNENSPFKRET